jgi:hypothetical protein
MFGAPNRDIGELELCGSTSAEFQRKQVPNSDQIAMISKHLGGNSVFKQRIVLQSFARLVLMLRLCGEEMIDPRVISIRPILMKSPAQVAEME